MPTLRLVAALCAALLMLAGCGRPEDGRPGASGAARHSEAAWRYDYTGKNPNASFTDIAAASADDVWAVGKSPVTGQIDNQQTLLLQYDGKTWRPYDLPPPLTRLDELPIVRLDASGPRDVWLFAGILTNPDKSHPPLAAHWDGTSWEAVDLPPHFPQHVHGAAVFGPDDAWVVAGTDTAWHWNGRQWRASRLPIRAHDLAGTSGRDLWAVGTGPRRELVSSAAALHWDGAKWTRATLPAVPPGPKDDTHFAQLTRVVALSAHDVRAFGSVGSEGGDTDAYSAALAMRWNGSRWTKEDRAPCCVTGQSSGALFLSPKRYLTPTGEERRIAQPPCISGRPGKLGDKGCRQKLQLEDYAAVPGTRQAWGVGSARGGAAPSRPVIVRVTTAP
ncbi:hypothetical protein P8605_07710 [Streptomyces sp. T-3]|nr:hypothetical protein [Streptomyces sp. T-3]